MKLIAYADLKQVKGIGYTRVHLQRLMAAGRFPKPVSLGTNRISWVEGEIDAWIKQKIEERDSHE